MAFLSYTRFDDQHEEQRISKLRDRLEGCIRSHTGLRIEIFQDVRKLEWGDKWRQEIPKAAAGSFFFIPIVTPSYFRSEACMEELRIFLEHQRKPGNDGIILPIYWIETDDLSDPAWRDANEMAQAIADCQHTDWRERRIEPLDSVESARLLEQMAKQVKARLKTLGVLRPAVPNSTGTFGSTPPKPVHSAVAPTHATTGGATETVSRTGTESSPESSPLDPKPRRRELVVDAGGTGQFKSISDAVKAAGPEDVILVRPGTYDQAVVIDKPVTVLGDGPREQVVLQAKNRDSIRFSGIFGRVANLTIRQTGRSFYGVDISSGRLELDNCDISSDGLACVVVRNGADPLIRGSRIHGGRSTGILVHDSGKGTFENNDISANTLAGMEVREGADPTVRGNRIHSGKTHGLLVHTTARGTFENNDIVRNAGCGVVVQEQADPVVRGNIIKGHTYEAIWVHKLGRGTFVGNDLRDNTLGPWDISPDCFANITRTDNIEK